MRLRPSRNRGFRTHDNLTIPHHLHGKVTLPMQPKPTQKPTPAREIMLESRKGQLLPAPGALGLMAFQK